MDSAVCAASFDMQYRICGIPFTTRGVSTQPWYLCAELREFVRVHCKILPSWTQIVVVLYCNVTQKIGALMLSLVFNVLYIPEWDSYTGSEHKPAVTLPG